MENASTPKPKRKCKWTKATVVEALRRFFSFADSSGNTPSLERDNQPLLGGARRVFGTVEAAMKAAGLPYPPVAPWTKESLIAEIQRRHAAGQDLSLSAVKDRSKGSLLGPAMHRFGSWRKAIEAAGIKYSEVCRQREWTKDQVLDELRQLQSKGENLGGGTVQKKHIPLWAAAKRYFGSYEDACLAAGIPVRRPPEEWAWPPERLIRAIQELHEAGVDLSSGRIRYSHIGLFLACRQRIGSWRKAVEDAGLDYTAIRKARPWTAGDVLAELQKLHAEGADLRPVVLQRQYIPLAGAVQRFYGTLKKAMEVAGLPYIGGTVVRSGSSHFTEEVVLQTLKDLYVEGYDLRYGNARRRQQPLFYAAKRLFGSYVQAIKEAGINYWEMSQEQLRLERSGTTEADGDAR